MPRLGPVMGASEAFHARMPNGPANQMSQPQSVPIQLLHLSDEFVQTEATKALSDKELSALIEVVAEKAAAGDVVGKRDYALLLFYVMTGMRRSEVIHLRGKDLEFEEDHLLVRCKIKGGDYVAREVGSPEVKDALLDYLRSCERLHALKSDAPLWTRHDRAGKPGTPLLSHAFAQNLKGYARLAGIDQIHLHQLRHSFARMVAEESGSITETRGGADASACLDDSGLRTADCR